MGKLVVSFLLALSFLPAASAARHHHAKRASPAPSPLSIEKVNDASLAPTLATKATGPAVLRAQILLDRARFSVGEIDGAFGSNMEKSVAAYQRENNLEPSGRLDRPTWDALNRDAEPALVNYTVTAADVAGPFAQIPSDMMAKAKLQAMGYASALEAIGEKFHASPELLKRLNRGKAVDREGQTIVVPNVADLPPLPKGARVIVDKSESAVALVDDAGKILAYFPASMGSEHDPLPLGQWKINGVARNPVFHYNPKLFWDANPSHAAARIAPGPNNPVGVVWIDLSRKNYGIHGTPEPAAIGKGQSHGCIRLTNWDAAALAQAVAPGMPATLQE